MTPIEIINQMIEKYQLGMDNENDNTFGVINALEETREKIMNECTVCLSDGDNTYDIPYALEKEFNSDMNELSEDNCADFDYKYSKYKV